MYPPIETKLRIATIERRAPRTENNPQGTLRRYTGGKNDTNSMTIESATVAPNRIMGNLPPRRSSHIGTFTGPVFVSGLIE
jgi:hypothetical protein